MHGSVGFAETKTIGRRLTSLPSFAALLTLGTGMSMQFLTLLTGAMSARLLGVEGRGEFAAVTLLPLLIVALGDLGGPIAYTYLSAEDPSRAPALARNALAITAVLGTALVVVCGMGTTLYLHDYPSLVRTSVMFGVTMIPPMLLGKHLNAIAQGTGRMVSFNLARLSPSLFYFLGLAALMLLNQGSLTLTLVSWVIGVVVFLLMSLRQLSGTFGPGPLLDWPLLKRTYTYGLRAHIGNVSPLDTYRVDLMLVVLFLDSREAGLYAVAVAAAMVVRAQATMLGLATVPALVRQPTAELKRQTAKKYFLGTCAFTFMVGLVMAIFAEPLITLVYGKDFREATTAAQILIGAMVLAGFRQALGDAVRAYNVPEISSLAEASSWVILLVCLPLIVSFLGVIGASLGVLITQLSSLLVSTILTVKRFGISPRLEA